MRTHKTTRERENSGMTGEQIARRNNLRRKANNAARKAERIKEAEKRLKEWRSLSYEEQLKELDKRPGNCKKQRAKIAAKIQVRKTKK